MIRTQAMTIQLGKNAVTLTLGWRDPAQLRSRDDFTKGMAEGFQRFQTRMKLLPTQSFSIETIAEFFHDDKILAPDTTKIQDMTTGAGVELTRDSEANIEG